jgi:hypothetical protein
LNANTLGRRVFELGNFAHEAAHDSGWKRLQISVKRVPNETGGEGDNHHGSLDDGGVDFKAKGLAEAGGG